MRLTMSLRDAAKRITSVNTRFVLRTHYNLWREHGLSGLARWTHMLSDAWIRDRVNRRHYHQLTSGQARARRKSDTVFIFGSGYSLHDLTPAEWAHFAAHDVFGFNQFFYQRWVPVDFHLLKGGFYNELRWKPYANDVASILRDNPHYERAVFVMQEGYLAQFTNQLVGYGLMPPSATLLRFRTARGEGPPGRSLSEGMRHHGGTLADAVNCAYALGWTTIVLVGVDLYDSRYFYLPADQTVVLDQATLTIGGAEHNQDRGQRFDQPHNTVRIGIVDVMANWRRLFETESVRLSVYNPRSVLADVLPVYPRPVAAELVTRS